MFINLAARRRRSGGAAAPPPAYPPVNTKTPTLALSPDNQTLLYGSGIWIGTPPLTVTARLFVEGVDTAPALPSMPILPAWRGRECGIREEARNAAGGPVYALSPEVLVPAPPLITGNPPVLGPLVNGATLDSATTWGTYSGTGTVTAQRQSRIDGGAWGSFVGTTVVSAGETWQLRERVSDDFNTNQVFLGNIVVVSGASFGEQVQAILSGKDAFVQDATDIATLFQSSDTTVPITAPGQTVRYWKSKWGATAATAIGAAASSPVWTGDALQFDDVDGFLSATVPGEWVAIEDFVAVFGIKTGPALPTNDPILGIGFGSTTGGRYVALSKDTSGRLVAIVRPGPAGPPETFQSATGVMQPDTTYTVSISVDYLAGTVVVRLNGVAVINATMAGVAGALSSAPNRVRIARDSNDGAGTFNGLISRWVFSRVGVSPADLATLEAWAGEEL